MAHRGRIQPGVLQRFAGGGDGQRGGPGDMGPVLGGNIVLFAEIRHFPGNLHGVLGGIESGDLSHSADTVPCRLPKLLAPYPIGTDGANSGHYHPSHHSLIFMCSLYTRAGSVSRVSWPRDKLPTLHPLLLRSVSRFPLVTPIRLSRLVLVYAVLRGCSLASPAEAPPFGSRQIATGLWSRKIESSPAVHDRLKPRPECPRLVGGALWKGIRST